MMWRRFFDRLFSNKPLLAVLATMIASLSLALVPVFVRYSQVGPTATAFYRFFLSLPLLMTWMIFDNVKDPNPKTPRTKQDYFMILGAGCFLGMDLIFWHASMIHTTVMNATLLNNLTVIFTALASWLFFKEKLTPPIMLGALLAVCGCGILVSHNLSGSTDHLFGDLLAFISAFFFTAFLLSVKKLRERFSSPTIMAWGALPTMYMLIIAACLLGENVLPQSLHGWWPLFALAIIVHILGQGLMTYSMAHMSASLSAVIMGLSPAFASLFGWLLFDESLTWLQAMGGILMLTAVIVAKQTRLSLRRAY